MHSPAICRRAVSLSPSRLEVKVESRSAPDGYERELPARARCCSGRLVFRSIAALTIAALAAAAAGVPATVAKRPASKTVAAPAITRWFSDYAMHRVPWRRWDQVAAARNPDRLVLAVFGEVGCLSCRALMRGPLASAEVSAIVSSRYSPALVDRAEYAEVADAYAAVFEKRGREGAAIVVMSPDLLPLQWIEAATTEELRVALQRSADRWPSDREAMLAESRTLMARAYLRVQPALAATEPVATRVVLEQLTAGFDDERDAFDETSHEVARLLPILRIGQRTGSSRSKDIGEAALRRVASSGIYDVIGGGVFRAAVDRGWSVPEFEKHLVDQVMLADAAMEAWAITRRDEHRDLAVRTLDFVVRDMQLEDGGLTHAFDSESLHPRGGPLLLHGIYYAWPSVEVQRLLGDALAARVFETFAMKAKGNVAKELDRYGSLAGLNLPLRSRAIPRDPAFTAAIEAMRALRHVRPRPAAELSAVTALNGAAISSLARAARQLGEPRYVDAAAKAALRIAGKLDPARRIVRHMTQSAAPATVDDLALFATGCLDLYEVSGNVQWLDRSLSAMRALETLWVPAAGRYRTGESVPEPVRPLLREGAGSRVTQHGAAALALLRLGAVTSNAEWEARAAAIVRSSPLASPASDPLLVLAADRVEADGEMQVTIVGPRGAPATEALMTVAYGTYAPYAEIFQFAGARSRAELAKRIPWVAQLELPVEPIVAVAYVCRSGRCSSAITDPALLSTQLH